MDDDINDEEPESSRGEAADPVVQSKKPEVIDIVYDRLIGSDKWPVGRRLIVDSDLLVEAIEERNSRYPAEKKKLSTKNPANFLKDFIRKPTCNTNWPRRLSELEITARQVYGAKQVFEFVPFSKGDELPFPDRFDPDFESIPVYPFEALSIPVEARKLGRQDEPWLIQIAVSQRLITTHLAIAAANAGLTVETLAHLQVSVKTQPEIDATFIATVKGSDGSRVRAYVTVEAKQVGERILEHQIREQIGIAFESTKLLQGDDAVQSVLPIVLKVVRKPNSRDRYVYIAQFEGIDRKNFEEEYRDALHELPLQVQSAALYEPHPPIAGVTVNPLKSKKARTSKVKRTKR